MASPLKNLYNQQYIELLVKSIYKFHNQFNKENFKRDIFDTSWHSLELKERMRHIATTLGVHLPNEYKNAIDILKKSFLQMNHSYNLENIIFQDFVAVYGMNNFKISMDALKHFTKKSTSEFSIRFFIIKFPKKSMQILKLWAEDEDEDVRRLASEGCRPRLPWAIALEEFKKEPKGVIEILELLKDDISPYVRKSVANSINDISKDNPQIVKDLAVRWLKEDESRYSLLKHGCRTLLKKSDKKTLELFGYKTPNNLSLIHFKHTEKTSATEDLSFSFELISNEVLGKIRVEYAIYFLRKNGSYNKKVFQIKDGFFETKTIYLSKAYSFKPITTRKYYQGLQKLSIIINGKEFISKEFQLQ